METRLLLRRGGSLEGLNRLNIRSCRWQFVPVLNDPWEERHLIHYDIGYGTKSLRDPHVLLSLDRMMDSDSAISTKLG